MLSSAKKQINGEKPNYSTCREKKLLADIDKSLKTLEWYSFKKKLQNISIKPLISLTLSNDAAITDFYFCSLPSQLSTVVLKLLVSYLPYFFYLWVDEIFDYPSTNYFLLFLFESMVFFN